MNVEDVRSDPVTLPELLTWNLFFAREDRFAPTEFNDHVPFVNLLHDSGDERANLVDAACARIKRPAKLTSGLRSFGPPARGTAWGVFLLLPRSLWAGMDVLAML